MAPVSQVIITACAHELRAEKVKNKTGDRLINQEEALEDSVEEDTQSDDSVSAAREMLDEVARETHEEAASEIHDEGDCSHIEDVVNRETHREAYLSEQENLKQKCERLEEEVDSLKEENRQLRQELLELRQEKEKAKRKIEVSDFSVGDRVEAFYFPDKKWYKATILKRMGSGYKIKYFDGYIETLNPKFIRQ